MERDATPLGLWRTLALITAVAAGVGAVVVLVHPARAPRGAVGSHDSGPAGSRPRPVSAAAPESPATEIEYPDLSREEQRALAPSEEEVAETMRHEFETLGGIDSPGTHPERAGREVDDESWAPRMEEELRAGLDDLVIGDGVTLDRVECTRGRCLVELHFGDMIDAIERIDSIRSWVRERVRCRVYSDGPEEGESPSALPSQQLWILCGEPTRRSE